MFKPNPVLSRGFLFALFLAALLVRIAGIGTFQLGDRQYRSALIARAYYLEAAGSTPEWQREVAETGRQRAGTLEPPIMELLVSWVYRLLNGEHLWVPGLLASLFWVIGGVFLYKLVTRIATIEAAAFAAAYYLFVPMGVFISTGFVPDPLMIMLYLLSLFLMVSYFERPSNLLLISAAIVSALAVLVKPFCLFPITGAFISLSVVRKNGWKEILNFRSFTFLAILLLPVLYYAYGIFAGGPLSGQAQSSFLPKLLAARSYWEGWLSTAASVVGFTPLVAALIGLPILGRGMPRAIIVGLSVGYVIFCMIFTYHIRFGPHYHSQLIVIVAISLGSLLALIVDQLRQLPNKNHSWLSIAGALLLVTVFNFRELRGMLPPNSLGADDVAVAREIGEIVDHSTRVVYLAPYYGTPLEYYGELSGYYWQRSISDKDRASGVMRQRSVEERLELAGFSPEYFVITSMDEFNRFHSDLKEYLTGRCELIAQSDRYFIYGGCSG